jgi:hypothetical protein
METKKCAFTKCEKTFEIKNPKKRFCGLSCKNKAAYDYQLKTYPWEIKQFKARRKNIQILEYVIASGKTTITLSELKILGFDFRAAHIPYIDKEQLKTFRYGNIGMKIISEKECEIFNILKP